jgi:hypothetical protein
VDGLTKEDAMRILIVAGLALLAGCATGPQNRRATLYVSMNGIQEVPGPGDPDGNGTVEINVVPGQGQVCWDLYARQIEPATAAHIHRGAEGIAGPVVLMLTAPDAAGHSRGCATVDPALAREMAWQGHAFYVNVHNATHPNGAIRGQLRGGPVSREERPAPAR